MRKTITIVLMLVVALLGFSTYAQAPQTGVYRIQNVGGNNYIKVTGKYDAQLVTSQSAASYITVGIEKKLSDGTYKVNSLASTYDGGSVEVYDYLTKALTLGEIELRRELAGSSEENVQTAINRMHELAQQYGFMRMMPVDGQADTYHAIAVLPTIPQDIVDVWIAKKNPNGDYVSPNTQGTTMWDWCIDIVYRYLDEHSGEGGTNAALASKIRNNLKYIKEGHTYMLTVDTDGSFGYIDTETETSQFTSSNNRSWWKLYPKVDNENVKDGTYKIHNIGQDKWVRIQSKFYATPDASEDQASDIRITFDGEANGGQKIVNLGGQAPDSTIIDGYEYIKRAIEIGKMAIYDVLTEGTEANPASPENIVVAQQFMEDFVKDNAFMCIKPVPGREDAVYAYAYIPEIPEEVVYQMWQHGAIEDNDPDLAWAFGVQKVMDYLEGHNSTLVQLITNNIENIHPNTTYYLGAEGNGTFAYAAEGTEGLLANDDYMWGFDVKDVEEDNLTSGTYKVRNVETGHYVQVLSKYYARPNTDEAGATEIHITYNGKLDDGSYKVTNMSAVAKNEEQADVQSYVEKAIKIGKVAIADVLNGMSSPENIERAKKYMEDFVRANAFMRVKPVVGTNYVYAIATIPEIPDEVVEEMVAHLDGVNNAEDCWNYGIQKVKDYLASHNTDGTLAQLINNIINDPNIKPGHTYYLKEDDNQTFGYVDALNFRSTDKTIQWGIDLEEEDQPVESDFYKIRNVATGKYVEVVGPYYATPSATEAEATPIAVTIDGMLEDGSMKIINLAGDGQDVQKYVAHAIEIGTTLIHQLLDDVSSPENVERAIEEMTNFVNENAYMRSKLVPGETDAYYAYVILPTVPQYIVDEWEKKYPNYTSDYNGGHTMRDWAVEKVLNYLNAHPQVNSRLAAMVRANIDRLYEGHTYYLRDDGDGTFGFGDYTEGEVTLTDTHYWWGFDEAIKAEPFSGYYRIKGADGKYVNVTGKFAAAPNLDATAAKTAAGSVIYIGTGETENTKTLPVEILRSQGVDVGDYMTMINDVLAVVAATASDVVTEKLNNDPDYSQYAGLVEPMVQTLLESVDLNLYVEPTLTSAGEEAYMLEVNIPDLAEYCDMALDALSLMGKSKEQLVNKLQRMQAEADGITVDDPATFNPSTLPAPSSTMAKLYNIAWRTAQYLDDPDEMWTKLKENAIPYVQTYFIDNNYDELLGVPGGVMGKVGQFILNALNNPDFNYGTTYCLRQDVDGTFGYASRESLIDKDEAKWILEPFDEQNPNYDETTYIPFAVSTQFEQDSYDNQGNPTGDTYNYTTTFLDFEAKIETNSAIAYTISNTTKETVEKNDGTELVYYLAKLNPIQGNIPAATPVVLRSSSDSEIVLRPVGKPEHPAVESGELEAVKDKILEMFQSKLSGITGQNAPSLRVISNAANSDNSILVGSFFGEEVKANDANTYLPLTSKTKREEGTPALDMEGLGFWKDNISELEGNKAYLNGDGQTDFNINTTFDNSTVGKAPGYVFQYVDNDTYTRIENVTANKEVKSVRYYNTLGVESTTPFEGVNIIVTTFTDGTQTTTKAIK
ncbi:MAG: hypothetical protein IK100_08375 [Muribaculaceae bacterium]|nr:hypothetical protein [Muribaculaceae bacterium]